MKIHKFQSRIYKTYCINNNNKIIYEQKKKRRRNISSPLNEE